MKLLVVGNGSIGKCDDDLFINKHTAEFLMTLSNDVDVTYAEAVSAFDENNNLQNFQISNTKIHPLLLPQNIKILKLLKRVYKATIKTEFLYLFYPGTSSKIFALFSILLNKPFGLYIRGQYYNRNRMDRYILKCSKFVLTVSPSIVDDTKRLCKSSEVIKPMIGITESDINCKRFYNFDKTLNLLFVGRVEERKGIYELIEIAHILKERGLKFQLKIVGGGDLFEKIKNNVSVRSLKNEVFLLGLVSDADKLKGLYDSADIFVFTSHDEGFPRVLYEAMASGLPIFTTFVGGISGRMENNKNCIEIPTRNAALSADIIYNEIQNHIKLQSIAKEGISTIKTIIDGELLPHAELLLKLIKNEKKA
jgi:glycosyltransferase involved in cell wall biosynthesis